jgi:hypothetical protein
MMDKKYHTVDWLSRIVCMGVQTRSPVLVCERDPLSRRGAGKLGEKNGHLQELRCVLGDDAKISCHAGPQVDPFREPLPSLHSG